MFKSKEGKILEFRAMSDWVGVLLEKMGRLEGKKGKYWNSEQ
jgi:hypothetical protein